MSKIYIYYRLKKNVIICIIRIMLKEYINQKSIEIEAELKSIFEKLQTTTIDTHTRAMFNEMLAYPVAAGGKRIRPILTLLACNMFNKDYKRAMIVGIALELIHTYSLVHDDLPAMDNDDMRRGQPTTHIKYGEANAILVGDGLLTHAFQTLCSANVDDGVLRRLLFELSSASGVDGMVYGQFIDLHYEKHDIDFEMLKILHSKKTAALIKCACRMGAIVGSCSDKNLEYITEYGQAIGLTFQIQDDILDYTADESLLGKTVGKDAKSDKLTYVKQFGLEGASEQARIVTESAIKSLSKIQNADKDIIAILIELANYIIERKH